MSESSLRRSSRRREKKPEKFTVGMIVEITRDRIRSKGRLVSKLTTDDAASNPRWLVAFDEKSWPEEDMYESAFGKIIGKVDDHNLETEEMQPRRNSNGAKTTTRKASPPPTPPPPESSGGSSPSSHQTPQSGHKKKNEVVATSPPQQVSLSDHDEKDEAGNNKKRKLMETDEEAVKSDDSAAQKKAKDREARRKRRQAVVEEEEVKMGDHSQVVNVVAKKKTKNGEDVIRVPLLTGTLLLYRGTQRRAEFIYKK